MEINAKPFILWIFYYIFGIDGFRIGNVDYSVSSMQVDNSRLFKLGQYSHVSPIPVNDRLKRFFEFNPVAFNRKSSNEPEQNIRNKFQFSPFITSLQNFKQNSEQKNAYPFTKFKSNYINNGEKQKSLRPYVDHFSGVKSFTLHLKNPEKEKLKTTTNQHLHREKSPVSKFIEKTFLKPKTKQLLKSESSLLNSERKDNILNNVNLKGMSTLDNNDRTVGNDDIITDDDLSRSNKFGDKNAYQSDTFNHDNSETKMDMFQQDIQNYASSFLNNKTVWGAFAPKLKKLPYNLPEYDSSFITDDRLMLSIDKWQDSADTSNKSELNQMFTRKQHQSHIEINDDNFDNSDTLNDIAPLKSLDAGFNSFGEFIEPTEKQGGLSSSNGQIYNAGGNEQFVDKVKITNIQKSNGNDINNEISVDDGFGNFEIYEEQNENNFVPNNEKLSFVDIITENSKPVFGIDAPFDNDFIDPLEEGFGSFSYDDTDCDNIHTKTCQSTSECSCYGLYHCHENKCTSNIYSSDYDIGQWWSLARGTSFV